MKNVKIITTALILMSSCNCEVLTDRQKEPQTVNSKQLNAVKEGELVSYSTIVRADDIYSVEIQTIYSYDSSFLRTEWIFDLNKIVVQQKLFFKKMNDILSKIEYEIGGKNKTQTKNGVIFTLDNVIVSSACIKGAKESFYKIEGFGGCNGCSEYTAYYSLQGELLYEDYVSSSKKLKYSKGNYKEILKIYGVTDSFKISKKVRGVQVYPPQYSGDTVEISIR